MLWLVLSLFASFAWAISIFFDNYITDEIYKGKTPQAMKGVNGFFVILFAFVIYAFSNHEALATWQIVCFLLAGAINSLATVPYYLGLRTEESTSAAVYFQLIPVIYLICGWLFFNEQITPTQIVGFIIIILAPLVVIFSRKRAISRQHELKSAAFFMGYVLLSSGSNIISTQLGGQVDYLTMIFFYLIGRGGMDLLMTAVTPSWRKRNKNVMRKKSFSLVLCCFIDQALSIAADCASRLSMIIGVTALASVVSSSTELIFTFILGIILSIIIPKFGREKLHRHLIIAHLAAVILCVIGIVILQ